MAFLFRCEIYHAFVKTLQIWTLAPLSMNLHLLRLGSCFTPLSQGVFRLTSVPQFRSSMHPSSWAPITFINLWNTVRSLRAPTRTHSKPSVHNHTSKAQKNTIWQFYSQVLVVKTSHCRRECIMSINTAVRNHIVKCSVTFCFDFTASVLFCVLTSHSVVLRTSAYMGYS